MNVVIKWGVILAALVTLLSVVVTASGLHKNPLIGGAGFIVVAMLVNLAVVFFALRETAAEKTYGAQLLQGVLIGLLGGVLIFLTSWVQLAVVFPDALQESREGALRLLEAAGVPADQVQEQIATMEQATPVGQAVSGLIGTFLTSTIAAALIGIFVRRK